MRSEIAQQESVERIRKVWVVVGLAFLIAVACQLIGSLTINVGIGKIVVFPMVWGIMFGALVSVQRLRPLGLDLQKAASALVGLSVPLLVARLAFNIGPSLPTMLKESPALLLQEIGHLLGTVALALPLAVFLIVEEAIRVSWQRLKACPKPRHDIQTATEDPVTHDLYEVMYDEVFHRGIVEGFDREHFTVVTREAKVRNYDGANLDKMPDMLVGIKGREDVCRNTQDWLFIECKPVDADHTVGVHYGAKGIARFIRGDYAWAMTSALMVGYASPGYTIDPKLFETLEARADEFKVQRGPIPCRRSPATSDAEKVHLTQHERTFNYVENSQPAPPIILRHLWLNRN